MLVFDAPRSPGGKRKQIYETVPDAKNKKQAEALLCKRVAELASGTYAIPATMTVDDLINRYLDARAGRIEGTTLALYRRTFDRHVRPLIGDVRAGSLTREHIERLIREGRDKSNRRCRGNSLSATTLRNILTRTRSVLEWGAKNYEGIRNVARNVEPPKGPEREILPFDGKRVGQLLQAIEGSELQSIVTTAIGTGLRRGELCALRWCDVNLDEARVHVRRAAALLDGEVIIKQPKTRKSRRIASLPDFVVPALRQHRTRQLERHLVLGVATGARTRWYSIGQTPRRGIQTNYRGSSRV